MKDANGLVHDQATWSEFVKVVKVFFDETRAGMDCQKLGNVNVWLSKYALR